jgi:hypothetical protein
MYARSFLELAQAAHRTATKSPVFIMPGLIANGTMRSDTPA